MKGNQEIVKGKDGPVVGIGEGGGFRCSACGRAYLKLGYLHRHYESSNCKADSASAVINVM